MRLTVLLGALLLALAPGRARAHGRPIQVDQLRFDPDAPDRLVLQTTFGLAVSEDLGASWRWVCAAVYRADPVLEDPAIALTAGRVIMGTFSGAASAPPPLCEWDLPEGPARDVYVVDVTADPTTPGRAWAVASDGRVPDRVLLSDDAGRSWSAVGPPIQDILVESIARAPSDPDRLYLAGAIAVGAATPRGFVLRSTDGAASLQTTELTLEPTERYPLVAAVDPTDADRLFVRVVRRVTDETPERLLYSDDGGASFREVFALRRIAGVAISDDGQTLTVGSAEGAGVHAARDGGFAFERVSDLTVRCLEARGDELWMCVDQRIDGFALGVSTDGGRTLEPRFDLTQVDELPRCEACSLTGFVCPAWLSDLRADQAQYLADGGGAVSTGLPRDAGDIALCGIDAGPGPDAGLDGGVAVDPEPGCGCRAASAGGDGLLHGAWLVIAWLALVLRRRPRG